jgi:hypothetical protein
MLKFCGLIFVILASFCQTEAEPNCSIPKVTDCVLKVRGAYTILSESSDKLVYSENTLKKLCETVNVADVDSCIKDTFVNCEDKIGDFIIKRGTEILGVYGNLTTSCKDPKLAVQKSGDRKCIEDLNLEQQAKTCHEKFPAEFEAVKKELQDIVARALQEIRAGAGPSSSRLAGSPKLEDIVPEKACCLGAKVMTCLSEVVTNKCGAGAVATLKSDEKFKTMKQKCGKSWDSCAA